MAYRDPRQIRTERHLLNAVFALAETRDLEALTIKDITEAAEIDRGTFYLHYRDKAAFLDKIATMLLKEVDEVAQAFEDPESYTGQEYTTEELPSLYKIVGRHPGLFRQLLERSGTTNFSARFQAQMEARLLTMLERSGPIASESDVPLHLRARFAAAGLIGFVSKWLEECNEEEIDRYTWWAWELIGALGVKTPVAAPGTS